VVIRDASGDALVPFPFCRRAAPDHRPAEERREGCMDRSVRRKLAMAASVRTFSRAHPSADASYALVLDRLDGTISRMEELAKRQEGGFVSKHSSVVRRQDLRRQLHQNCFGTW